MATITPQNCSAAACNGGSCNVSECDGCDGYSPYNDGDPCVDCGRPVWYAEDHDTWYHAVEGECFLATYRKKPEAQGEPEEPADDFRTYHSISNEEAGRMLDIASKSRPICYGARVWKTDDPTAEGVFVCVFRKANREIISARIYWD